MLNDLDKTLVHLGAYIAVLEGELAKAQAYIKELEAKSKEESKK